MAQWSFVLMVAIASTRELLYYFAPDAELLNPVDYALFLISIPYLLLAFRLSPRSVKIIIFILSFLGVVVTALGQIQLGNNLDNTNAIKTLFPIVLIILGLFSDMKLSRLQLRLTYLLLVLLAISGELRIFGGSTAVSITEVRHSTAYLLIGVAICVWVSKLRLAQKVFVEAVLIVPLFLINVATAIIGFGIFVLLEVANRLNWGTAIRASLFGLIVLAVLYSRVDVSNIKVSEIGLLGSGRVAAWEDGLSSFASHGFYSQIFGQGSGSSFRYWGVWWWAQKDIHSDFLRILIENGLLVLSTLVVSVFYLVVKFGKVQPRTVAILLSAISTSIISNGVLGRPYATVLWALAGVIWFNSAQSTDTKFKDGEVSEKPESRLVQQNL
jgi:hypothetical protein